MILAAQQARLILAGKKTQVRLRVTEPRDANRPNGTAYRTEPFRPRYEQLLAIRVPREREPVCSVIVTGFHHQLLAEVDFDAARAEGHRTTVDFKAWWVRQHDPHWIDRQETTTADDGVEEYEALADDTLAARYDQRWAKVAVWAIQFELDRSHPARFLAVTGRGDERGYTLNADQALPDEPEAPDDGWLKIFSAEGEDANARRRGEVEDSQLAERRDLGQRLLNARALARERGVDVTSDLRVIERRIEAIEQRIRTQHSKAA